MTGFFRFPHTPHLAWLGNREPREDKVLSPSEAASLLSAPVVVEEKLDGANLGFSVSPDGELRLQNRGQYLLEPFSGQFARLSGWLPGHRGALLEALGCELMLFGEWCAARHSIFYTSLPDWFLVFDVYDKSTCCFWSARRRDEFARQLGLVTVPEIFRGRASLEELKRDLLNLKSACGAPELEGVVVRTEDDRHLIARAKLVRPNFLQAIGEHWSRKALEWNRLGA
jgi:ATP-dependent RNA circularization protein (DNA/RNA ligase family)